MKEIGTGTEHNLITAIDGVEALKKLGPEIAGKAPIFDMIILDLNMPRMNGFEFLEIVKSRQTQSSIPIIILTTSSNESDILKAYRLKANCYVTKPLDINEFIDTVQKLSDFWMSILNRQQAA